MLAGALALIVGLLVAEIVVGLAASSLALLADAGHMLTDAAALALALVAASFARRPPGGSWTFGFRRVEILAALANGITLALVGIWIVFEAVRRAVSPPDVPCRVPPAAPGARHPPHPPGHGPTPGPRPHKPQTLESWK